VEVTAENGMIFCLILAVYTYPQDFRSLFPRMMITIKESEVFQDRHRVLVVKID
jgi:hypothetical protein